LIARLEHDEGVRRIGRIGSEASSAVPVRENTVLISGIPASAFSIWNCIFWLCSTDVPGTRKSGHKNIAFIELGQKLLAEGQIAADGECKRSHGNTECALGMTQSLVETGS
jgi:hypothetical protein